MNIVERIESEGKTVYGAPFCSLFNDKSLTDIAKLLGLKDTISGKELILKAVKSGAITEDDVYRISCEPYL